MFAQREQKVRSFHGWGLPCGDDLRDRRAGGLDMAGAGGVLCHAVSVRKGEERRRGRSGGNQETQSCRASVKLKNGFSGTS